MSQSDEDASARSNTASTRRATRTTPTAWPSRLSTTPSSSTSTAPGPYGRWRIVATQNTDVRPGRRH